MASVRSRRYDLFLRNPSTFNNECVTVDLSLDGLKIWSSDGILLSTYPLQEFNYWIPGGPILELFIRNDADYQDIRVVLMGSRHTCQELSDALLAYCYQRLDLKGEIVSPGDSYGRGAAYPNQVRRQNMAGYGDTYSTSYDEFNNSKLIPNVTVGRPSSMAWTMPQRSADEYGSLAVECCAWMAGHNGFEANITEGRYRNASSVFGRRIMESPSLKQGAEWLWLYGRKAPKNEVKNCMFSFLQNLGLDVVLSALGNSVQWLRQVNWSKLLMLVAKVVAGLCSFLLTGNPSCIIIPAATAFASLGSVYRPRIEEGSSSLRNRDPRSIELARVFDYDLISAVCENLDIS